MQRRYVGWRGLGAVSGDGHDQTHFDVDVACPARAGDCGGPRSRRPWRARRWRLAWWWLARRRMGRLGFGLLPLLLRQSVSLLLRLAHGQGLAPRLHGVAAG